VKRKNKETEQESKLLPPTEGMDEKDYKCATCGADIRNQLTELIHQLTGVPVDKLKNGDGLKEIHWKLQIAERTMTIAGIEINESVITEKALEHVEKLLSKRLSDEEREKYEQQIKHSKELFEKEEEHLKEKIEEMNEKIREICNNHEKLESEYEELKTKVKSNPSMKGMLAQAELLEDLEGNFPEQSPHFEDIARKGHGDILWSDIQINMQEMWTSSGVGAIIDSKDKGKISEKEDIEKLKRDMQLRNKNIGVLVAKNQSQLRLKEVPCGIEFCQEGYVFITSRENLDHHIVLRFIRDVLARKMYELKDKQKTLDTDKLKTLLNDIMEYKNYHVKIKSKASGIITDIDSEEKFIDVKIKEYGNPFGEIKEGKMPKELYCC